MEMSKTGPSSWAITRDDIIVSSKVPNVKVVRTNNDGNLETSIVFYGSPIMGRPGRCEKNHAYLLGEDKLIINIVREEDKTEHGMKEDSAVVFTLTFYDTDNTMVWRKNDIQHINTKDKVMNLVNNTKAAVLIVIS